MVRIFLTRSLLLLTFVTFHYYIGAQEMDNTRLLELLSKAATVEGDPGVWEVNYNGRFILVISDELANRMRMISPIKEAGSLSDEEIRNALEANFATALDVKYAISEGIMWSIYLHPLRELSEQQVIDALGQVYKAAESFGASYSSTDLVFPDADRDKDEKKKSPPTKKM